MVQSQAGNIKSGWKNIFAAFALAASGKTLLIKYSSK